MNGDRAGGPGRETWTPTHEAEKGRIRAGTGGGWWAGETSALKMQLVPGEAAHVALWRAAGSEPGHPEPRQHLAGEAAGGQGRGCDPSESGQGESQEEGKILNTRG